MQVLGIIIADLQVKRTLFRLLVEMLQTVNRNREDVFLSQYSGIVLPHRVVGAVHQHFNTIFRIKLKRNRTRRITQRFGTADWYLQELLFLLHVLELRQSDAHIALVVRIFSINETKIDTRSILQHPEFIFDRIRTNLVIHIVDGDDISLLGDRQQTECMRTKLESLLQLRGCSQNQFTIVDIRLDFCQISSIDSRILHIPKRSTCTILITESMESLQEMSLIELLLTTDEPIIFHTSNGDTSTHVWVGGMQVCIHGDIRIRPVAAYSIISNHLTLGITNHHRLLHHFKQFTVAGAHHVSVSPHAGIIRIVKA